MWGNHASVFATPSKSLLIASPSASTVEPGSPATPAVSWELSTSEHLADLEAATLTGPHSFPVTNGVIYSLKQSLKECSQTPHRTALAGRAKHRRAEYRRQVAALQRQERARENRQRLKLARNRVEWSVKEKQTATQLQLGLKQTRATQVRNEHLSAVRLRAREESWKVSALHFLSQALQDELWQKLQAKQQTAQFRREAALNQVRLQQSLAALKVLAARERRQQLHTTCGELYSSPAPVSLADEEFPVQ